MDYNRINLEIIIRYLNGICSEDEEQRLKDWMQEDTENEEFLLFVKKIWDTSSKKKKIRDVDSAWMRFNKQYDLKPEASSSPRSNIVSFDQVKRKSFSSRWASWSIVAVAAALLIVFISLNLVDTAPVDNTKEVAGTVQYRTVETEKGQRTRLRLSDGSTVQLNAESRLLIPKTFNASNQREVILDGEAYFEVTHNPDRQFVVTTNYAVTKVLGTKFNINSYGIENKVTVAVAEGSVSLERKEGDTASGKTIIKNQFGTFLKDGSTVVTESDDMAQFLGWTNGNLVFMQDSLTTVIQKLERWYGIDIEVDEDLDYLTGKKLTATFTDRQRLDEVLESISLVLDFEYEHSTYLAKKYTFYNNQQKR